MKSQNNHWTKTELEIYILLLCAGADSVETKEEVDLIRSRFDTKTFESIHHEFKKDTEDEGLNKIEENIRFHEYSHKELSEIWSEMKKVFYSDKRYGTCSAQDNLLRFHIFGIGLYSSR